LIQQDVNFNAWAFIFLDANPAMLTIRRARDSHVDVAAMSTRDRVLYALPEHYDYYLANPRRFFEYLRIRIERYIDHNRLIEDIGLTDVWNTTTKCLDFLALRRVFDPSDRFFLPFDMEQLDVDRIILIAQWTFDQIGRAHV
jgi:hypothetical protein